MQELYYMSWDEFEDATRKILRQIEEKKIKIDTIIPVLRGGATLGAVLNNNLDNTEIAYIHVKRSESNGVNAVLGEPVLRGITNVEKITGKDVLIVDDMLDKGVTMEFVIKSIKKLEPKSIKVAVIYNFTKLKDEDMFIIGATKKKKKWIVYPWEKEINV